jgi:hypothetical protein
VPTSDRVLRKTRRQAPLSVTGLRLMILLPIGVGAAIFLVSVWWGSLTHERVMRSIPPRSISSRPNLLSVKPGRPRHAAPRRSASAAIVSAVVVTMLSGAAAFAMSPSVRGGLRHELRELGTLLAPRPRAERATSMAKPSGVVSARSDPDDLPGPAAEASVAASPPAHRRHHTTSHGPSAPSGQRQRAGDPVSVAHHDDTKDPAPSPSPVHPRRLGGAG